MNRNNEGIHVAKIIAYAVMGESLDVNAAEPQIDAASLRASHEQSARKPLTTEEELPANLR